ncbi:MULTISPECIES: OmpA family protein [Cellulophaga]|uniref:OmpA family protein n=1 Tax=Cellulophaga TaxID=104264 RepID=UPI0020914C79|nr:MULTISPECIES: OmpA family protein [Cellulophaga]MDO6768122.1 OmpA family protein [Cellulophaga sp. 1_MG-2023]
MECSAYPSRISVGRYFKSGLGLEAIATYNKYKVGKTIDGIVNEVEKDYFAIDSRLSYDLNKLVGETGWFDPYLGVGLGFTRANNASRGTINGVVGFRTWFSDRIGLDFNSSGKWAMNQSEGVTNHLQHAVGFVYQFGIEKELSKSGEEKLALIEAIEKENQRKNDSIASAEKEAILLTERIKREQEQVALALAEKEKLEARERKINDLQSKIDDFGAINFALNSSNLNRSSKTVLSLIVNLLKANPTVTIKLGAYTDSRGTDTYNLSLSERRMQKTLDYLTINGIEQERIISNSYGEKGLLNNCIDGVYCTESEHKINRRIDIVINNF